MPFFGLPKPYCQNHTGREFNNELLHELCEQFNISVKSRAAEAPWSNGTVEQYNAVLGKISKLLLDNYSQYPTDFIVSWAVIAKNALHICYGFSPNQLVFGRNPNWPSNLIN